MATTKRIIAFIIIGTAIRLGMASWGGYPADIAQYTDWASVGLQHGLLSVYRLSDASSDAIYPPPFLALLVALRWMFGLLPLANWGIADIPVWLVILKLPAIMADLGISLLVWRLGQDRPRVDLLVAGVAFNPVLIYLSALWGQTDSMYALPVLASVIVATKDRPFWAGFLIGLGMMIKLHAGLIGPVILLMVLARTAGERPLIGLGTARQLAALAGGVVLPITAAMGPYVLAGQTEIVQRNMLFYEAGKGWLTYNALNGWYLFSGGAGNWAPGASLTWPDTAPLILGITARMVGRIMGIIWIASNLWLAWLAGTKKEMPSRMTTGAGWLLAGALSYLGAFLWMTRMRDRYAFCTVVLLGGALAVMVGTLEQKDITALLIWVTGFHTLNLVWAAPVSMKLNGWFAQNVAV